jgi:hypothetical protein
MQQRRTASERVATGIVVRRVAKPLFKEKGREREREREREMGMTKWNNHRFAALLTNIYLCSTFNIKLFNNQSELTWCEHAC